jgi:peptidoglycan/LPS O-acetylase OafA/YrhL
LAKYIERTPVLHAGVLRWNPFVLTMPVYFGLTLCVAWLSYTLFERPIMRLKDRPNSALDPWFARADDAGTRGDPSEPVGLPEAADAQSASM